jgi:predicted component of type VI protein secretion system
MVFRFLILLTLLSACSNIERIELEEDLQNKKSYKIELSSMIHIPYCGGAYPDPEQAQGYFIPSEIQLYYLTTDSVLTPKSVYQTIETSDDSKFYFRIDQGVYFLQHPDKKLSLSEFMKKNGSQNTNQTMLDSDCYLKWKNTPDLKLIVKSDTTIQITYHAACFTGTNPCLRYDGPYPP